MKTFHCDRCNQQVFFENTRCENCGGMLGYEPERREINTYELTDGGLWRSLNAKSPHRMYKQCINYSREDVCNWMLPANENHELCASCRLTHIIPALSSEKNRLYWKRLEAAKRRLLYSLWELHLQPTPKLEDPHAGLAFEFLEDTPEKRVMTGHSNGLITLNIAEADPAHREKTREQMHEPYRTLLGHFRHESGHYYFDQLIAGSRWLDAFRELYGDERADYAQALQRHYDEGPVADWDQRFVSAYAASHPWEDWAESWAHYLHMIDTLDTAFHCGIAARPKKASEPEMVIEEKPVHSESFSDMMSNWFALTYVLNSLNRSIGMPDAYPFALSPLVIGKLEFIHQVILARREEVRNQD
jgi:hypothetical protein